MGSATALPQVPTEKTVFVEDMTDQQLASAVSNIYVFIAPCAQCGPHI